MDVTAMTIPCNVSVTLTAQNPPSKVYSTTIALPRRIALLVPISNVSAKVFPAPWNWDATYSVRNTRTMAEPSPEIAPRKRVPGGPASSSVTVTAPRSRASFCNLGARKYQLRTNPPTQDGNSQIAGNPNAHANPETPSSVQADEELALALSAATHGPSFLPPR